MIGFTCKADANASLEWSVSLHAQKPEIAPNTTPLSDW